jgi:hypothetical protein
MKTILLLSLLISIIDKTLSQDTSEGLLEKRRLEMTILKPEAITAGRIFAELKGKAQEEYFLMNR